MKMMTIGFASNGSLELNGDRELCMAAAEKKFKGFPGNVYVNYKLVN